MWYTILVEEGWEDAIVYLQWLYYWRGDWHGRHDVWISNSTWFDSGREVCVQFDIFFCMTLTIVVCRTMECIKEAAWDNHDNQTIGVIWQWRERTHGICIFSLSLKFVWLQAIHLLLCDLSLSLLVLPVVQSKPTQTPTPHQSNNFLLLNHRWSLCHNLSKFMWTIGRTCGKNRRPMGLLDRKRYGRLCYFYTCASKLSTTWLLAIQYGLLCFQCRQQQPYITKRSKHPWTCSRWRTKCIVDTIRTLASSKTISCSFGRTLNAFTMIPLRPFIVWLTISNDDIMSLCSLC